MNERGLDSALHRALLAARDRREQLGATRDGTMVLDTLGAEEALALDGLLTPRKPILPGQTRRIPLSQFEAALRALGTDPRREYERVGGRPLRDRPAQRAAIRLTRDRFRAWLGEHPVLQSRPAIAAWLDEATQQGRVHAEMQPLVRRALRIVAVLPSALPIQRTVLAAQLLDGDPHGLDVDTPLHRLTVALLTAGARLDPDTSPRSVWAAWNVLVDPISSSVTVLNLPLLGDGIVAELTRAMRGTHITLTYGQLARDELRWPPGVQCFSCENPSVLVAAEEQLGPACPPLICTGGRPSDAVRLLLCAVHTAGAPLRHHGDHDLAGVQILRDLEVRHGGVPWRFDVAALGHALRSAGRAWPDPPPASLEEAVSRVEGGLAEELVINDLLDDLGRAPAFEDTIDIDMAGANSTRSRRAQSPANGFSTRTPA